MILIVTSLPSRSTTSVSSLSPDAFTNGLTSSVTLTAVPLMLSILSPLLIPALSAGESLLTDDMTAGP